ncbi:hypothetical protein [Senegalia massiliensis]|uniref:Aminoglycoside phosphotransferase domain-containing protein n=1 Tax=Senegalia massiliensis TaxID=1720316 RepID=A0A845R1X2_9CLOT|nr:hypothetical protein [Senegalia massiliensis]NBI07716.1 hypothetical protein [Senegalia massiliensis]
MIIKSDIYTDITINKLDDLKKLKPLLMKKSILLMMWECKILFNDKVLKIQTLSDESENEYHVMEWLQGKLPVPKILGFERDKKKTYILMTKVAGEMSCAEKYLKKPEQLTTLLAEGLQMLC